MTHIGNYAELIVSSSSFAHLLEDIHQNEKEQEEGVEKHLRTNLHEQSSMISSKPSEKGHEEEGSTLLNDVDVKQEGTVGWRVYRSYIRAGVGSLFGFLLIMLLFVAQQTTSMYSRWWLALWSDDENYRHKTYPNCSSMKEEKVNRIRMMNTNEWNEYRNEKFYIYCCE